MCWVVLEGCKLGHICSASVYEGSLWGLRINCRSHCGNRKTNQKTPQWAKLDCLEGQLLGESVMVIDTPPQHGNSEASVAEDRKDFCVAYLSARRLSAILYLCHRGKKELRNLLECLPGLGLRWLIFTSAHISLSKAGQGPLTAA